MHIGVFGNVEREDRVDSMYHEVWGAARAFLNGDTFGPEYVGGDSDPTRVWRRFEQRLPNVSVPSFDNPIGL